MIGFGKDGRQQQLLQELQQIFIMPVNKKQI